MISIGVDVAKGKSMFCFMREDGIGIVSPFEAAHTERKIMEVMQMRFSYNKLFKLLIDRGINKKTLQEMSGISATSVAKLGKGGNVNTDVLLRICGTLKCGVGDIIEFIDDDKAVEE